MKDNKVILFIVAVAVAVVLLLAAAVVLFFRVSDLKKTQKNLSSKVGSLNDFYKRNPFPSVENIAVETENVVSMTNRFAEIIEALKKKQVEKKKITPTMFMAILGETKNRIQGAAKDRTALPPAQTFWMGFDKYAKGDIMPDPTKDVPQLYQQLIIIESLCNVLIEERAVEVSSITRDVFEDAGPVRAPQIGVPPGAHGSMQADVGVPPAGSAPGIGVPPGQAPGQGDAHGGKAAVLDRSIFSKQHFILQFQAKEAALANILNRLARHDMIIVVTSLEIDNRSADLSKVAGGTTWNPGAAAMKAVAVDKDDPFALPKEKDPKTLAAAKPPAAPAEKDRDERIVTSQERLAPMQIKLELDVYNFRLEQEQEKERQ